MAAGEAATLPRRQFTVADVLAMQEAGILADGHCELLGGELVTMAAKRNDHELVKNGLVEFLMRRLPRAMRAMVKSTLFLSDHEAPEPDIMVYPRQLLPEAVRGTDVVLVVEVATESLRQDLGVKAVLYARAGVAAYWVVDARTRRVHVHEGPLDDGNWQSQQICADTDPLPAIAGLEPGSLAAILEEAA